MKSKVLDRLLSIKVFKCNSAFTIGAVVMGSERSERVGEKVCEAIKEAQDVVLAYVFGSKASGKEHAFSDVDVAILLRDPSLSRAMRIHSLLTDFLGGNVDTLLLNFAPPLLRYRVIKDGLRVLSRDDDARVSFEARALSEALDEGFLIEEVRRGVFRRFKAERGSR